MDVPPVNPLLCLPPLLTAADGPQTPAGFQNRRIGPGSDDGKHRGVQKVYLGCRPEGTIDRRQVQQSLRVGCVHLTNNTRGSRNNSVYFPPHSRMCNIKHEGNWIQLDICTFIYICTYTWHL